MKIYYCQRCGFGNAIADDKSNQPDARSKAIQVLKRVIGTPESAAIEAVDAISDLIEALSND